MITSPHPAPPRLRSAEIKAGIKAARQRRAEMIPPPKAHVLSDAELEELKGELRGRIWILQ